MNRSYSNAASGAVATAISDSNRHRGCLHFNWLTVEVRTVIFGGTRVTEYRSRQNYWSADRRLCCRPLHRSNSDHASLAVDRHRTRRFLDHVSFWIKDGQNVAVSLTQQITFGVLNLGSVRSNRYFRDLAVHRSEIVSGCLMVGANSHSRTISFDDHL